MKKLPLLLALAMAAAPTMRAAAPAEAPAAPAAPSIESIDTLLSVSHADRTRDVMVAAVQRGIDPVIKRVLQGQPPTAAEKAVIDDMHRKIKAALESALNPQEIKAANEKVYARNFTQAQIDDMIAFYNSPTGRVFADRQLVIAQEIGAITQKQMMSGMMKMQGIIRDEVEKLQEAHEAAADSAAGGDQTPAAGSEAGPPAVAPASSAATATAAVAASASVESTHAKGRLPLQIGHGKRIMLTDYLVPGKTTVFDFYSEYCPPCRALKPMIKKLHKQRDDVAVVEVDINRPGIVGIDWDSPVAHQFHLDSIPHLEVYSPKGSLVAQGDDAYKLVQGWIDTLN